MYSFQHDDSNKNNTRIGELYFTFVKTSSEHLIAQFLHTFHVENKYRVSLFD